MKEVFSIPLDNENPLYKNCPKCGREILEGKEVWHDGCTDCLPARSSCAGDVKTICVPPPFEVLKGKEALKVLNYRVTCHECGTTDVPEIERWKYAGHFRVRCAQCQEILLDLLPVTEDVYVPPFPDKDDRLYRLACFDCGYTKMSRDYEKSCQDLICPECGGKDIIVTPSIKVE